MKTQRGVRARPALVHSIGHRTEKAVLRIHIDDRDGLTSLMLEGKLVGPWVRELENCWQRTPFRISGAYQAFRYARNQSGSVNFFS
jgi:hypothetical protein